ncbi:MAG: hypothetical protein KBD37_04405, partial [Burkholderiales bacterium]|nr:hypothetical protein [Burkholderiales bacterium]
MLPLSTTVLTKVKSINLKIMAIIFIASCCIFTGCESSTAINTNAGTLVISPFAESTIAMGESTTATVALVGNSESNALITVTIINNNSSVMSESPSTCILLANSPNNQCTVILTGISAGSATFSASSPGYTTITSESLTITPAGVLFGTIQGLVFNNGTVLAGTESIASINAYNLTATTRDSSGNLYAGTSNGIVWKYATGGNTWIMLGTSKVDNSPINSLAVDST